MTNKEANEEISEQQLKSFGEAVVELAAKLLSDQQGFFIYVLDNNSSLAITFGNCCPKCCIEQINELDLEHWSKEKEVMH